MFKNLTYKLSSNASTVIVFVAAFSYLAYLNSVNPDKAGDQLLPVLAAATGLARVLYQVDEAKAKSDAAAAQSQNNGAYLATIDAKVDDNTTVTQDSKRDLAEVKQVQVETHALVNGQTEEFKQALIELAAQKIELAEQKAEIAAQKAEIAAILETAKSVLAVRAANELGIVAGRAQVTAEHAAFRPPPVGTVAEPQPDGTILVEAPAVIKVVPPGDV